MFHSLIYPFDHTTDITRYSTLANTIESRIRKKFDIIVACYFLIASPNPIVMQQGENDTMVIIG